MRPPSAETPRSSAHRATAISTGAAGVSVARGLAALLAPARVEVGASTPGGRISVVVGSSFSGGLVTAAATPIAASPITANAPQDTAQWQSLQRQAHLPLCMPTAWSPGLGYDQFRAYRVKAGHSSVPAAVVVGTTPQGGYWDVQALRWKDPPVLADPTAVRTVDGRSYSLYYDDAALHMVAWRAGGATYWVSNTLDDELSNPLMLALAESCTPLKR